MANILCLCSEPSGDRLLATFLEGFRRSGHSVRGVGGPLSIDAGLDAIAHIDSLSATGLVEALGSIPAHVMIFYRVLAHLDWADAVFIVDSPELGVRLIGRARRAGKRIAYLAPPQAWAWRPWRASVLKNCNWVGCLFDFERDWFASRGVDAVCVGHPALADTKPLQPGDRRQLALLPGSRTAPIARMLPIFIKAAVRLFQADLIDGVHLGLREGTRLPPDLESMLDEHSFIKRAHDAHNALASSGVALAHFGTITLDAVLAGRPVVAAGCVHPMSYALVKPFVRTRYFALPNLILGRRGFPELVQGECKPGRLAEEFGYLLSRFEQAYGACLDVRGTMGFCKDTATVSVLTALQLD